MAMKRQFWQTKEDFFPQDGLCKTAESLPAIKRSNDECVDSDRGLVRKNVMKAVDLLMRNPSEAGDTFTWLTNRLDRKKNAAAAIEDTWGTISTLGKVNVVWLSKWLQTRSLLSKHALERSKAHDPMSIVHLVCFELNALPTLVLAPECQEQQVLSLAMVARANSVGSRLAKVTDASIGDRGEIQWLTIGAYDIVEVDKNDMVRVVKHTFSGDQARVPNHVIVNDDFALECNWSDQKACFVYSKTKHYISSFFGDGCGPHKDKFISGKSAVFQHIVKQEVLKIERKAQEAKVGRVELGEETWFDNLKSESRQKAIANARNGLKARQEELAGKRRLSIKTRLSCKTEPKSEEPAEEQG